MFKEPGSAIQSRAATFSWPPDFSFFLLPLLFGAAAAAEPTFPPFHVSAVARVTGLGEFSPSRRLFTLDSFFLKIANFWATFLLVQIMY
jgi:hypothetical protein